MRMTWRRGIVVIASASRTEDPGFESRQDVMVFGLYTLLCCFQNSICIVIVCIWEDKLVKKNLMRINLCTKNSIEMYTVLKPSSLARFEPAVLCSVGGGDDHYIPTRRRKGQRIIKTEMIHKNPAIIN
jgi:hypothetical protein